LTGGKWGKYFMQKKRMGEKERDYLAANLIITGATVATVRRDGTN
jgi:hypothetical protein